MPKTTSPRPKKAPKAPPLTQEQVLQRLALPGKKFIVSTVRRYANGPYSSIFNEAEMSALAQDVALEVTRRVLIGQKNSRAKDSVDLKGCEAYYSKSLINRCQKMYEMYAKTDIRAGVQTVSSDEALAAASSKHLTTPENDWILQQEIKRLLEELETIDQRVNKLVTETAVRENRIPQPEEFQYSRKILELSLQGYEPLEIRTEIKLSESDYARHRRSALELAKERLGFSFSELLEHITPEEDYRIYMRDVKKRKKSPNRIRNYSVAPNFYIQTSLDHANKKARTSLYVRIDITEGDEVARDVKPKLIKLEEQESNINATDEIRQELWSKTKSVDFINKVKSMGEKYLKSLKKSA